MWSEDTDLLNGSLAPVEGTKPAASYRRDPRDFIVVGCDAYVVVVDHPGGHRGRLVSTSRVLSHDANTGHFETVNTIYTPAEGS